MPKNKFALGRLRSFVFEFGENVFAIVDAETLLCRCCEVKVDHSRRSSVVQHLKTEKHARAAKQLVHENRKTAELERFAARDSTFDADLCDAMVSADIPVEKLSDPVFRNFLENYTGHAVPAESALRDRFVDDRYGRTMDRIRRRVTGCKIWVSVDETCCTVDGGGGGRLFVANVVVGTLEEAGAIFLLNTEVLEKINHSTVSKLIDKSLAALWPDRIRHDDVLLFVSDAAPYMVKCARYLNALYSKMIHVTCVGRALHGACEEIRWRFGTVDKIVGHVPKIFEKSPSRLQAFRRHAPGVPLPPPPPSADDVRSTGLGSWIGSAIYCCDHFDGVRDVVDALADSGDDAVSVKAAKKNLAKKRSRADLTYVKSNFGPLLRSVRKLETVGTPLVESLRAVDDVRTRLRTVRDGPGSGAYEKLENFLNENVGMETLRRISTMMHGGDTIDVNGLPEDLTANDLDFYEYAPIAAVDVERSFPGHKSFLADHGRSLKSENTRKHLVSECNLGE